MRKRLVAATALLVASQTVTGCMPMMVVDGFQFEVGRNLNDVIFGFTVVVIFALVICGPIIYGAWKAKRPARAALSRLERDILDDCTYGGVDVIRLRLMLAATRWFGRPRWRDVHDAINRLEKAGYLGTRLEPRLGNVPKLVLYTLPKGWQALGRPHKPHRAHR